MRNITWKFRENESFSMTAFIMSHFQWRFSSKRYVIVHCTILKPSFEGWQNTILHMLICNKVCNSENLKEGITVQIKRLDDIRTFLLFKITSETHRKQNRETGSWTEVVFIAQRKDHKSSNRNHCVI